MKGDEFKVRTFHGQLQISFHVRRDALVEITREGEDHAEEGWVIDMKVVPTICSDFNDDLFETMVKSS